MIETKRSSDKSQLLVVAALLLLLVFTGFPNFTAVAGGRVKAELSGEINYAGENAMRKNFLRLTND
jgi:hypothetical protein